MACYSPLRGFMAEGRFVFDERAPMRIPCGHCVGCRLEYSRQWMIRIMHEASLYKDNCFLTLTYENAPVSLRYKDFQDFMKRYRKMFSNNVIRFYMAGEYGEENKRAHFHACIFGHDFEDKKVFSRRRGNRLYVSVALQKLWPYGFSTIGQLTAQSAAYVARYVMKKRGADHPDYEFVNPQTGEVHQRVPEFCRMSLKPGIGQGWFDKYKSDVFPKDRIVFNGKELGVPRYYLNLLKRHDRDMYDAVKEKRWEYRHSAMFFANNSPKRLAVREEVALSKAKILKREL